MDIVNAIAGLDAWLETMRGAGGYSGPVSHWWEQSLIYTGSALDWRYEGIVIGYLQLWEYTGDQRWLEKACRAGDDLISGQFENGHFAASGFEVNPTTAGTPHEAACDIGLLTLADRLRHIGDKAWEKYANCAELNLINFYLHQLWDEDATYFRDHPRVQSFVPNKAATACEALFMLAKTRGNDALVEKYILPTLKYIVAHQVQEPGLLHGAIAQNSFGDRKVEKYFPIYIARCIPALVNGYSFTQKQYFIESALSAMEFISRCVSQDGSLPTVIYPNQRVNRYPGWIAPLSDILRSADLLRPYGFDNNLAVMRERLLLGQDVSGGFQTATGFAAQAGGRPPELPDVRDVLHVVGWCDKAFRYLTEKLSGDGMIPAASSLTFETDCTFLGMRMHLVETLDQLEIWAGRRIRYRWCKGQPFPEVAEAEFWLK